MRDRIPFEYLFAAGLAAGILIMIFGRSSLPENAGLWDQAVLEQIASTTLTGGALFVYLMTRRGSRFLLQSLAATTYLGIAVSAVAALWYGVACGVFFMAALAGYGLKGILLVAGGMLPQYLVYAPMEYGLWQWSARTCQMIYKTKTPVLTERVFKWLMLLAALVTGCLLESFINPPLLRGVVKLL